MPKIIYIEPQGYHTPLLFDTFKGAFADNGYDETANELEVDIIFVDLYSYLRPMDLHYCRGRFLVLFDFTDRGGMSHEPEPDWAYYESEVLNNNKIIYFMRKMDKTKEYPKYVYPIEHIIECEFQNVTKEELSNRPNDICWIGNSSPQRQSVVKGLQEGGFKMDVHWTNEGGKISHSDWLQRHRNAKMFLTADGGGFGDERIHQLGTVAIILKQKNNQLQVNPFKHGYDCREVSEDPTEYEIEHLKSFLQSPQAMYQTYLKGAAKLRKDYSAEARSKYLLEILKKNAL